MYIDPKTKEIFNYATPISCEINPQNVVALDLDSAGHFVLTRKHALRATPLLSEPKQVKSA